MLELVDPYAIIYPPIVSGSTYYFKTEKATEYEVRFGKKQDDVLCATIVFGVLNEEFEGSEYVTTNRFEVFRVMATLVKIVRRYKDVHPKIRTFEFTGEPTNKKLDNNGRIRLGLYNRYLKYVFDDSWNVIRETNKIIVQKNRNK